MEVQEKYGAKPRELDILFPMDDADQIFDQYYKLYGQSAGLKAKSDGVTIWTKPEKPGDNWPASPAPSKEELMKMGFRAIGTLTFILPMVSYAGTYQIRTTSYHSIVKLNSSIDYIRTLFGGRIRGLPLKLILEPTEAHITIQGVPSKKVVYTMRLDFDINNIVKYLEKQKEKLGSFSAPAVPMLEAGVEQEEELEDDEDLGDGVSRSDLPK